MTYIGETIKKLGFGFMRLPLLSDEVDIEQTRQMVDIFMENGFSYFDTAPSYLRGKSEEAIKTTLVDRYPRESYQLATKLVACMGKIYRPGDTVPILGFSQAYWGRIL